MPRTLSLLAEEIDMKKYETLLQAQLAAYPDSLVLTDRQMYDALRHEIPDWIENHKFEDWTHYDARHEMGWFSDMYYREWKRAQIEQTRAQWTRNAFYYRSGDVDGFFYACGKREDGTYRHVGFRYGLEEPEYASGFDGMGYTQGESK
jgi:hypothetical protein